MESRQFRIKKLKAQIRLFFPLVLLLVSLVFIGFGTFQNKLLNQFKMALQETVSPIVQVLSLPIHYGKKVYDSGVSFLNTYKENNQLKIENEQLKNWRNIALQLQTEQQALKELLNYKPPFKSTTLTAKVLQDTGHRFVKSLLVQAGSNQGVSKGDIAMTPDGILGRVVEVGSDASRLMLLTDYASRVPVMIGESKIHAILSGDGSNRPKVVSIPEDVTVSVGDIVLTSGQVGVYPSGLGIGIVSEIEQGDVKVRLFEEDDWPEFVQLVNFGLNDILLSTTCHTEDK